MDRVEVRRALVRLENIGSTADVMGDFEKIKAEAKKFANGRRWNLVASPIDGGARVEHVVKPERARAWPELDTIRIGGEYVFHVPETLHRSIKQAVARRRLEGVKLFYEYAKRDPKTGERTLRVFRLDPDSREARMNEALDRITAEKPDRWGLNQLAVQREIRVQCNPDDVQKVRQSVNRVATVRGWKLSAKKEFGGFVRVTREDMPPNWGPPPQIIEPGVRQ
jgi:hypothetical protein